MTQLIFVENKSGDFRYSLILSPEQFVKLLKSDKPSSIFSTYGASMSLHEAKPYYLFLLKDSKIIACNLEKKDDKAELREYFNLESLGYAEFEEYLDSEFLRISKKINYKMTDNCALYTGNYNDDQTGHFYRAFKKSTFYSRSQHAFVDFIDARQKNFYDKKEYDEAKLRKIPNKNEYNEFKSSKYQVYENFIAAREGKFKNRADFLEAMKLKISTYNEYIAFINKGFKEHLSKLKEIMDDSAVAYKSHRYEEFIRLGYLKCEKITILLYYKIFDKDLSENKDFKIDRTLKEIQTKLNKNFEAIDQLHKWRITRNKIVHEHEKITQTIAKEAYDFFEDYTRQLEKEFFEYR